jgi:hypothetical protein
MLPAFQTLFEVKGMSSPVVDGEDDARFSVTGVKERLAMTATARVHIVTTKGRDAWVEVFASGSTAYAKSALQEMDFVLKTFSFEPLE